MSEVSSPAATAFDALMRRALSLGVANAFDYALQFLVPVVLVRFLAPEAFAQYRLLWLAIATVMVLVPLNMPQTLYFFLPRSDAAAKRLYVHMTLLYLFGAGLIGGLLISTWNPLLPANMRSLSEFGVLVPALMVLCAVTFMLDILPTIEERVHLQAALTIALSLLRAATLCWAVWLTGELRVLIWMLLALMLLKLLLLFVYIAKAHGFAGPWFRRRPFVEQFRHAAPFGASNALYGMRGQADQWVVAGLFALGSFASFSVAAVLAPMVNLFRQSVNHVFMPSMSRLQAAGNMAGMIDLNKRANVMVATLVYPLLAFAFVFAEEIITLIYTEAYIAAAPVMRVYVAGLLIFVIELSGILLLLRQGTFAMGLNLAMLLGSVGLSWFAASHFGLAGAAVGSTAALYVDRYATLRRIGSITAIPVRNLQNWRTLGWLLLISGLAGSFAWVVVVGYFATAGVFLRMIVGGSLLMSMYGALWSLSGVARERLLVLRSNHMRH